LPQSGSSLLQQIKAFASSLMARLLLFSMRKNGGRKQTQPAHSREFMAAGRKKLHFKLLMLMRRRPTKRVWAPLFFIEKAPAGLK
jgi:hypothetical protein